MHPGTTGKVTETPANIIQGLFAHYAKSKQTLAILETLGKIQSYITGGGEERKLLWKKLFSRFEGDI